jgi:anaerobic magnesium-protoporphyrin IX monomethyl ester cyclase
MKVLLIYPGSGGFELAPDVRISTGAFLPPLGLLYLASVLESLGHTVEVIDCNAEEPHDVTLERALQSADVVGMTIHSEPQELKYSIALAQKIKHFAPDVPFLLGGSHCLLYPELVINTHQADVCVRGEGEYVIGPLLDAFEGKRSLSSIPGITFQEKGHIHSTPSLGQIQNLDDLLFPSRHLVEKYKYGYFLGTKIIKGNVTSLMISRGCPGCCTFCQVSSFLPKYRVRSAKNSIQEIDDLIQKGYNSFAFVDDNFLGNKKIAEQIMDHIITQHYDIHLWILDTRVDSADRKLYEKMRDAGVEHISFGMESGNQEIIDFYKKKITLDQIRTAVKLSKEMGFLVSGDFIIGAPFETEEHIKKTIRFAKSLPLDNVVFSHLVYAARSPLWVQAVEEGKINSDEFMVSSGRSRGLAQFDADDLEAFCMKAYRNFFFDPRYWFREISHAISHRDLTVLDLGLRMLHLK